MSMFVDRVLAESERAFGPRIDPAVLERYAREAVLDVWLRDPNLTVSAAEHLLRRLRTAIARRTRSHAVPEDPFPDSERAA